MEYLVGTLIENDKIISEARFAFSDAEFFLAYVNICLTLDIQVPLWSYTNEVILKRDKTIKLLLDNGRELQLETITS